MHITDELLGRMAFEPLSAGIQACKLVTAKASPATVNHYREELLEVVLFLFAAGDAGFLKYSASRPVVENGKISPIDTYAFIVAVLRDLEATLATEKAAALQQTLENRFAKILNAGFGYELTDGDLKEAQSLINQLREFIQNSPDLGEDHRRRLLKQLEALQSELNKNLSSLDRFYCFAIEASIVAGKIGENAKPLINPAKALFKLMWRTHAHKEGLPSGAQPPMLGHDDGPASLE